MWESAVELVRLAIIGTAHVCAGSLGVAVVLVSFGARVALLPLTLRVARHARAQQERLAALKPALEALQKRHAKDPARLMRETHALHRAHGINLFTPGGIVALMLQVPLFGALFAATRNGLGEKVRFLWIAELTRPDAALAWIVSGLAAVVMATAMAGGNNNAPVAGVVPLMTLVVGITTLVFLLSASSAVALSVGAGSLASALQTWILARDRRVGASA